MNKFPNDATGAALDLFQQEGLDLSKPLEMDFCLAVPSQKIGIQVATKVENLGFKTSVENDGYGEVSEGWTCYCTKTLIPKYSEIVAMEDKLDGIAQLYGGYIDGFGTLISPTYH